MATWNMGYVEATGEVLVAMAPETIPATYETNAVTALPQTVHTEDDDGLPGHEHDVSHALYHHVREALYHVSAADAAESAMFPENITDMQRIKIRRHGNLMNATAIKASPLVIESEGESETATLAVKYLPSGNSITANSLSFTSNDTNVVTVDSNGVVTAVDLGETSIKVKLTGTSLEINVPVSVVEPAPPE